jgi:hypothetical protein
VIRLVTLLGAAKERGLLAVRADAPSPARVGWRSSRALNGRGPSSDSP